MIKITRLEKKTKNVIKKKKNYKLRQRNITGGGGQKGMKQPRKYIENSR